MTFCLSQNNLTNNKFSCLEIYLLPSRIAEKRSGRQAKRRRTADHRWTQRPRYSHSLPRTINTTENRVRDCSQQVVKPKEKNLTLPKLRPPFVFGPN